MRPLEVQRAAGVPVDPAAAMVIYYGIAARRATRGRLDEATALVRRNRALRRPSRDASTAPRSPAARSPTSSKAAANSTKPCASAPKKKSPSTTRLGDVRSRAVTMGQIADILSKPRPTRRSLAHPHRRRNPRLQTGSATCEARRHHGQNRRHPPKPRPTSTKPCASAPKKKSPSTSRLGDVRERAVTMGQIADILQSRGQLDEALRILHARNSSPPSTGLGDVRSRAVTMGETADILPKPRPTRRSLAHPHRRTTPRLQTGSATCESAPSPWAKSPTSSKAAANLDEALRIRTEEEIPVYKQARRRARAHRHHGQNRRHPPKPRPTSTKPCASAPKKNSPSTNRLGDVR